MRSLDLILADADRLIENTVAGSTKVASAAPVSEAEQLAQQLLTAVSATKTAAAEKTTDGTAVQTLLEKVAHSIAIVDTLRNLPTLMKIAELEEKAAAAGYTPEQVSSVLEKNAAALPFKSVLDDMPHLTAG